MSTGIFVQPIYLSNIEKKSIFCLYQAAQEPYLNAGSGSRHRLKRPVPTGSVSHYTVRMLPTIAAPAGRSLTPRVSFQTTFLCWIRIVGAAPIMFPTFRQCGNICSVSEAFLGFAFFMVKH